MIKNFEIFIKKENEDSFSCEIVIKDGKQYSLKFISDILGEQVWYGIDFLDCFNQLRSFVENKGFLILVNGTVENTWASGGLRDSSNGLLTYLLDAQLNHTTLNIFEYCDINNVTYDKHIEYYKNWLKLHK